MSSDNYTRRESSVCRRASVHNGARPAAPGAVQGRVGAQGFTARMAAATTTTARSSFECDVVVCSRRQVLVRLRPIYRWQRSRATYHENASSRHACGRTTTTTVMMTTAQPSLWELCVVVVSSLLVTGTPKLPSPAPILLLHSERHDALWET